MGRNLCPKVSKNRRIKGRRIQKSRIFIQFVFMPRYKFSYRLVCFRDSNDEVSCTYDLAGLGMAGLGS